MTETLCSSAAVKRRAGANADADIIASAAAMSEFINQAEGEIVAQTRRDWVDDYSNVDSGIKECLEAACAARAAMQVIQYDPNAYNSLAEAQTLLNVQFDTWNSNLQRLKDFKSKTIKDI